MAKALNTVYLSAGNYRQLVEEHVLAAERVKKLAEENDRLSLNIESLRTVVSMRTADIENLKEKLKHEEESSLYWFRKFQEIEDALKKLTGQAKASGGEEEHA